MGGTHSPVDMNSRQTQDLPGDTGGKRAPESLDPLVHAFYFLECDPATPLPRLRTSCDKASSRGSISTDVLADIYSNLRDPVRRLALELAYPLDSSRDQIKLFYQVLSGSGLSADETLRMANQFAPLSRANLIAYGASSPEPKAELLPALLDAHISIEVSDVYRTLQAFRHQAGLALPSLANVRVALHALFETHCAAMMVASHPIHSASAAVFGLTGRLLETPERARRDALMVMVSVYARIAARALSSHGERIDLLCQAIGAKPDDPASIGQLADELREWVSLCGPMLLAQFQDERHENLTAGVPERLQKLAGELIRGRQYRAADKVLRLALDAFRSIPRVHNQLINIAALLREIHVKSSIDQLSQLIEQFESRSDQTAETDEAASKFAVLWETFVAAVEATGPSDSRPWELLLAFALHRDQVGSVEVAHRLIEDMMSYGQTVSADAAILELLREDLGRINRTRDSSSAQRAGRTIGRKTILVASLALTALCISAAFWMLGGRSASVSEEAAVGKLAPELLPAVGKGQRLALEYIRYCHFQEERLRIVKQHVRSAEDIGAYNALAGDYNSRCSDFYFQDQDLAIVKSEMIARQTLLRADAERIIATWPWHTRIKVKSAPTAK